MMKQQFSCMVSANACHNFSFCLFSKCKFLPSRDFLKTVQTDISSAMRTMLLDWLVEVAQEYDLTSETYFLTVNYIDRFLSLVSIPRTKLQLFGMICLLLAAKYEEIYPPCVDDFVYMADNTYSKEEVSA